jgi:predicted aminopeptidase
VFFCFSLPFLTGCSSVSYLVQATQGQFELLNRSRPIPEVVKDQTVAPETRALLGEIESIKTFAGGQGLRATKNYQDYVDLRRDAVVWVVSASPALKFEPKTWSFPIVGSFTYLGWFDREAALRHGSELREQGWDVSVRGAGAYSSLGWFKDPVLSTMFRKGPDARAELVEVILHESVHATVYINGQSWLNESLADFVAEKLTPLYLGESESQERYLKSKREGEIWGKKMHATYEELAKLYGSSESDEVKLRRKGEILARLQEEHRSERRWNNASLIQFRTYGSAHAEFEALLQVCGGRISDFLNLLGQLKAEDFGRPQREDIGALISELTLEISRRGCSPKT